MWQDLRELLLVLVIFPPQQKTSKKTKKIPPYDRNFVVQQYIKLLQVYYDSNAWKTPVVFVAEMEQ